MAMWEHLEVSWPGGSRRIDRGQPLTIGRADDCDIQIDNPEVLRHHARLIAGMDGDISLADLGSANGTSVNGVRLEAGVPVRVSPGDNVFLASVLLVITGTPLSVTPAPPEPARELPGEAMAPAAVRQPRAVAAKAHVVTRMLIASAFIVVFLTYTASNAVDSKLLAAEYYKGVLDDSNAYERAYTEVAPDPALSEQVADLVGGVELPLGEIAGAVRLVAPPSLLQLAVEAAIDRLIEYLKNHRSLDVSIDVTPIVAVTDIGGITDIITDVIGRPTRQADTYEGFLVDLQAAADQVKASGSLPDVIPDFDIPEGKRTEVAGLILRAGGLDRANPGDSEAINKVEDAVAGNDMEEALAAGMRAFLTGGGGKSLVQGKFIHEVIEDGQARYYLGPTPETSRALDEVISIVHLVSWAAGWGRFAMLALGGVLLALLARLSFPGGRRSVALWLGVTLVAAGALTFVGWLWGRDAGQDRILQATLGDQSTVPESYEALYRDVLANAAANLTPTIWLPCIVVMAAGAGLVVGTRLVRRQASSGRA